MRVCFPDAFDIVEFIAYVEQETLCIDPRGYPSLRSQDRRGHPPSSTAQFSIRLAEFGPITRPSAKELLSRGFCQRGIWLLRPSREGHRARRH